MIDDKASNKRSIQSVLINRPMQREFTLVMLAIMMTAAVAIGILINRTLTGISEDAPITISRLTLERMISEANSQLVVSAILTIFIAVVLTGMFSVFFLHRVAGPVYRIRQTLRKMGSGEIPGDVQLRRRDFFKETADELNRVIQLLREFDDTTQKVDNFLNQLPKGTLPGDMIQRMDEIHKALIELRKTSK